MTNTLPGGLSRFVHISRRPSAGRALGVALGVVAALTLAGCSAPGNPIPQGTTSQAPADPGDAPAESSAAPASTCDRVREAFLTGSAAEIRAALQALIRDRSADGTAREYAQKYLTETDKDLRDMDKSLIQMSCPQ
jgi:hypothetical protein